MPAVVLTKVIKPKKLDVAAIRVELEKAVTWEGEAIRKEYEKTTRTWHHKPVFEVLPEVSNTEVSVLVGTDDKIYLFLDEGTKVRYATLSRDWQSKTTPGIIGSGPGRGRVLFVSKKRPRPGIKARRFTPTIQSRRKRPFQQAMLAATKKGADKANARGQA
jgi:hypothetical protein